MIQGEVHIGVLGTCCQTAFRKNCGISLPLRIYENEWFSRKIPKSSLHWVLSFLKMKNYIDI